MDKKCLSCKGGCKGISSNCKKCKGECEEGKKLKQLSDKYKMNDFDNIFNGGSKASGFIKLIMAKKAGLKPSDYKKGVAREKKTYGAEKGNLNMLDSPSLDDNREDAVQFASPYLIKRYGQAKSKKFIKLYKEKFNNEPSLWDLVGLFDLDVKTKDLDKYFEKLDQYFALPEYKIKQLIEAKIKAKQPKPVKEKKVKVPKPVFADLSDEDKLKELIRRKDNTKSEAVSEKLSKQITKLKSKIRDTVPKSGVIKFKGKGLTGGRYDPFAPEVLARLEAKRKAGPQQYECPYIYTQSEDIKRGDTVRDVDGMRVSNTLVYPQSIPCDKFLEKRYNEMIAFNKSKMKPKGFWEQFAEGFFSPIKAVADVASYIPGVSGIAKAVSEGIGSIGYGKPVDFKKALKGGGPNPAYLAQKMASRGAYYAQKRALEDPVYQADLKRRQEEWDKANPYECRYIYAPKEDIDKGDNPEEFEGIKISRTRTRRMGIPCEEYVKEKMEEYARYKQSNKGFWQQFADGFFAPIKMVADIASNIPGIGSIGKAVSTGIGLLGYGKPDGYELHTVVIKKPIDLVEAKRISKNFITKSKEYNRETKTSYRFRNIPKQKFEPKSFRTKKVNKQISLIYGKLK
jgi:hypothetical protein